MIGEGGLNERAQGAGDAGTGQHRRTEQQRTTTQTHQTGPTGDVG